MHVSSQSQPFVAACLLFAVVALFESPLAFGDERLTKYVDQLLANDDSESARSWRAIGKGREVEITLFYEVIQPFANSVGRELALDETVEKHQVAVSIVLMLPKDFPMFDEIAGAAGPAMIVQKRHDTDVPQAIIIAHCAVLSKTGVLSAYGKTTSVVFNPDGKGQNEDGRIVTRYWKPGPK